MWGGHETIRVLPGPGRVNGLKTKSMLSGFKLEVQTPRIYPECEYVSIRTKEGWPQEHHHLHGHIEETQNMWPNAGKALITRGRIRVRVGARVWASMKCSRL